MRRKTVILCMMVPALLLSGCYGRTISLAPASKASAAVKPAAAAVTANNQPGGAAETRAAGVPVPPAIPLTPSPAPTATKTVAYPNPATVEGDVQTITSQFTSRRYAPITVQAGIPVRWTIQVAQGNLTGCNNAMLIRQFNIEQRLKVGDTVVEFTPEKTGTIPYSCWMGMIRSTITVVDDLAETKNL
jgi:hypothetical protein